MIIPSNYPPSESINFPLLQRVGSGERITQILTVLSASQTVTIPQGAIFYSINLSQSTGASPAPATCTVTIDGVTSSLNAPLSHTGFGPTMENITITSTSVGVTVLYGINNTINATNGLN